MVGGATMKKHLQVIAKFLPDRIVLGKETEIVYNRPREEAVKEVNEEAKVTDTEFDTFQLGCFPLLKACHDWLELMVLHFDTTQHLANYMKETKGPSVVIKIVSQAPPDQYMLPWKVLLENEAYFLDNNTSFPVAGIIGFLTPLTTSMTITESFLDGHLDSTGNPTTSITNNTPQIISAKALVQQLREIGKIPKVIDTNNGRQVWNLEAFNEAIEPIIETVKNLELTNCISVDWEEYANTIVQRLMALQNAWTLSDNDTTMEDISNIIRMIKTMRDNAKIYWALRPNSALDTGIGFISNFHAKAILAAFLHQCQKTGSVSHPFPCPA